MNKYYYLAYVKLILEKRRGEEKAHRQKGFGGGFAKLFQEN